MCFCLAASHVAVVAFFAGCWDAFEDSACVAGFARYGTVGAVERKGRGAMVEVAVNFDCGRGFLCSGLSSNQQKHRENNR